MAPPPPGYPPYPPQGYPPQGYPQQGYPPPGYPPPGYPPPGYPPPGYGAPPYGYGYPPAGSWPQVPAYPYAGWWRRAAGWLLDGLIVYAVPVVLLVIGGVASHGHTVPGCDPQFSDCARVTQVSVVLFILAGAVLLFLIVAYPVYFIAKRGQTIGMKKMGVRLYRIDPVTGHLGPPGTGVSWGRWAITLGFSIVSSIVVLLDYLWAAWDQKHQCLHDKVAGTVAIDEARLHSDAP